MQSIPAVKIAILPLPAYAKVIIQLNSRVD